MRSFHLGEPGANPITGNVSFTATDMVISIPGLTYEITRTYNSQNDGESILGRGWSFGFDSRCEIYSDGVIVYFPDGSSDIFWRDEDDYYTSKYSRRTAEWTSLDPFIFTVTEPTQEKYHFNLDGKLTHIEDRYGNRTAVTYTDQKISSLTDAAGRTYTLETNKDGKLIKLSDPMGNEVRYTYNEKATSLPYPMSLAAQQITPMTKKAILKKSPTRTDTSYSVSPTAKTKKQKKTHRNH